MAEDNTKEESRVEENGTKEETSKESSPPFIRDSSECPEKDKHKLFLSGLIEQEGVL